MVKVIISGCNGFMGHVVEDICSKDADINVVAGFDVNLAERSYPVFASPANYTGEADVVIDFSSPKALEGLLRFCKERKLPVVLATTGYSDEQIADIVAASKEILSRSVSRSIRWIAAVSAVASQPTIFFPRT
jgi:4-hydroxy-tetrahydrodipicolinate reductase